MSIIQLFEAFGTQEQAINHLEKVRWQGNPTCPYCKSDDVGTHASPDRKARRWQCRSCGRAFSVTVGTLFHGTHVPLRDWFFVLALMLNSSKPANAHQIARDLGMRRPTVGNMIRRARKAMATDPSQEELLTALVEPAKATAEGEH